MQLKFAALAALCVLLSGLFTSACGGSGHEDHAHSLYDAYRTAEDARTDAEEELRLAFADISSAAQKLDRAAVIAAAQRGQDAVEKIDDLIGAQIEAAQGLAEIESTAPPATAGSCRRPTCGTSRRSRSTWRSRGSSRSGAQTAR